MQIAGALQGALDLSVRYAQERSQFGRPLSKFQAVQHMLAQLAGEAVATAAAARMACARMDDGDGSLAVTVAKLRAGRAVEKDAMSTRDAECMLALLALAFDRWPSFDPGVSPVDHLRWKMASPGALFRCHRYRFIVVKQKKVLHCGSPVLYAPAA